MNIRAITIGLFVVTLVAHSCLKKDAFSNREVIRVSERDFREILNVKSDYSKLNSDSLILPTKCVIVKNYLVLADRKASSPLHIFDIDRGVYLGGFGRKGQGPGEIGLPWLLSTTEDDRLLVYDVQSRKILEFYVDSLVLSGRPNEEFKFVQEAIPYSIALKDDKFYYTDFVNPGGQFFEATKFSSKPTNAYGGLLYNSKNVADITLAQSNRSALALHANSIAIATHLSPLLEIFDMNTNVRKSVLGPEAFPPIFDEFKGPLANRFAITKDTRLGHIGIQATADGIYVLYSGDKVLDSTMDQGQTILVFDYQGRPQKMLKLDQPISAFVVSTASKIYAIAVDLKPKILELNF